MNGGSLPPTVSALRLMPDLQLEVAFLLCSNTENEKPPHPIYVFVIIKTSKLNIG